MLCKINNFIGFYTIKILIGKGISEKYFRLAEVDELLGDHTKAKKELG
jgi:GDP-D-mannose dehydratase